MSKISVIVPVYNVENYLHRCVDSILAQTFTDFELILINDGSQDQSGALCDEYAKMDSRIAVIHKENQGAAAAKNDGLDKTFESSASEWVMFVDSDDWIHPRMIEILYNAAVENRVDISVCGYQNTQGEAITVRDECEITLWDSEEFYVQHNINAVVPWGKLYKKTCFSGVRYPVGKIYEDEYVTYRLLFAQERIAVTSASLYAYFQNPTGVMATRSISKKVALIELYEELLAFFEENGRKKAFAMQAYSCYLTLRQERQEISCFHTEGRKARRLLYKAEANAYKKLNYAQKCSVWNTRYPRLMKVWWKIHAVKERLIKRMEKV